MNLKCIPCPRIIGITESMTTVQMKILKVKHHKDCKPLAPKAKRKSDDTACLHIDVRSVIDEQFEAESAVR